MCVFHVHLPWGLHLSGTVGMSGKISTMLCWRRFFPLRSPFIATLAPSLATLSCSHTRNRQSHVLTRVRLTCQRLNSILRYFCNALTFQWRKRNQNFSIIKWPRNQMLLLRRRYSNVVATSWQRRAATLS